jgi:hypothetical protein
MLYGLNNGNIKHDDSLTQLDLETLGDEVTQTELNLVDFFIRERPIHTAIHDTETLAHTLGLGMCELINDFDAFSQVASFVSHELIKVIIVPVAVALRARHPHANVLVARRILTVGNKFCDASRAELRQESTVFAPEQAYVRHVKQYHCKSLQAQPKRISHIFVRILKTRIFHDIFLYESAAKYFHPFVIEENFKLKTRLSERKVRINPAHLCGFAKQCPTNTF